MVTTKQFEFFRLLYDEEVDRQKSLSESARHYISLTTFYSAFIIFVIDKLRPESCLQKAVFLLTGLSMLGAFLLSLIAIRIRTYEALNNPKDIMDEIQVGGMHDSEFFDRRAADCVVACEENSKINDTRANQIQVAGYCLFLGIGFHAAYFVLRIL